VQTIFAEKRTVKLVHLRALMVVPGRIGGGQGGV
jgi:hypothetical protein